MGEGTNDRVHQFGSHQNLALEGTTDMEPAYLTGFSHCVVSR